MAQGRTGYEIMKRLRSVNEKFRSMKNERFRMSELTGTQQMMIGLIGHMGPLKMSDLGQKMSLSPSAASEMVTRLEEAGILVRERDSADRRVVRVALAESYLPRWQKQAEQFRAFLEDLFAQATEEQMTAILVGLDTLDVLLAERMEHMQKENHS